jgi:hypothetical protein
MQPRKISITLTCGLIAGLAMILLTTVLYLSGVSAYLGPAAYLGYAILLTMAIVAPLREKKAGGGYLEFRDALKAAFLVFVIALALQTLFSWVLMNYIDPAFRQAVEQVIMEKMEKFMLRMNMSQDKIDEALSKDRGANQFSLSKSMIGLCVSYIVFFLISLVIAAIVKKKKPEFNEADLK